MHRTSIKEPDWDSAVTDAMAHGSVTVHSSAAALLDRLVPDIRDAVAAALAGVEAQWYCLAGVLVEDAPVGRWVLWKREDRPDVLWLIIVVARDLYEAIPLHLAAQATARQATNGEHEGGK